jgi:hypothetical protein
MKAKPRPDGTVMRDVNFDMVKLSDLLSAQAQSAP